MIRIAALRIYRRIFEPTFDELTLFVLAYSCLLLIGTNTYEFIKSGELHPNKDGLVALIPIGIIAVGIALSLYHAFSKRKK